MKVAAILVVVAILQLLQMTAGLTIEEIGFTPERCAAIRADVASFGFIPCPCRLNTGKVEAVACYPNCCPKTEDLEGDRCHTENKLDWSVYEQQVCAERPPPEYLSDNPNCFYRGNIPLINKVTTGATTTHLEFELSILDEHRCDNLFISRCRNWRRAFPDDDFRINTTDTPPGHCWLNCPPIPVAECTKDSCIYHKGETRSVIRSWDIATRLEPGDYALSCYTLAKGDAVGSSLFQNAYATIGFKIN